MLRLVTIMPWKIIILTWQVTLLPWQETLSPRQDTILHRQDSNSLLSIRMVKEHSFSDAPNWSQSLVPLSIEYYIDALKCLS